LTRLIFILQMMESLSVINLEDCTFLTDLRSLREAPFLTTLRLDRCSNLVNIDESIGFLDKLRLLSAKHCTKLKTLAPSIMLTYLETLDLWGCESLESFPEVLGKMEKIRKVYLDSTGIEKLPFSIGNFVWLELLSLKGCEKLHQVPGSISIMPKVKVVVHYGHEVYQIFEEELSSEVSPRAMLIGDSDVYLDVYNSHHVYLDVYYSYVSPNNVIRVCPPNQLLHSDFRLLFSKIQREDDRLWLNHNSEGISFRFRNKFPKVALCCSILAPALKSVVVMNLKFKVFIDHTLQFKALCNFIVGGGSKTTLWCDLEGKVEELFSELKWNRADIYFKLDCPMQRNCEDEKPKRSIGGGSLIWSLIGVYEEGNNKEDIRVYDNRERSSSLPSSLYNVIRG